MTTNGAVVHFEGQDLAMLSHSHVSLRTKLNFKCFHLSIFLMLIPTLKLIYFTKGVDNFTPSC